MHCPGRSAIAVAALTALPLAGCAGSSGDERLTVAAAASLTEAFGEYGETLPGEQSFSFGGSDELTAQIRQGAEPDLFASADLAYSEALAEGGLAGEPVVFARNRLVIAAPEGSEIDSLADLATPGLDLVIGADGVPVGEYAREVLRGLPAAERAAIALNVRSEEPDTKSIVGKLTQGAAEAGFVYATDVAAATGELEAIGLPARLRPEVELGISVVAGSERREAAETFIEGLLDGAGARALAEAGFGAPR